MKSLRRGRSNRWLAPDPIAIVEASYRVGGSDERWLAGVYSAVAPAIDATHGTLCFLFDRNACQAPSVWSLQSKGLDESFVSAIPKLYAHMPAALRRRVFSGFPALASARRDLDIDPRKLAKNEQLPDTIAVQACDVSGVGCLVGAVVSEPASVPARVSAHWARLAAHMAAGLRLQRCLAGANLEQKAQAILDAGGRILHAEGEARRSGVRTQLTQSVRRIERARGNLRCRNSGAALDMWPALSANDYSLVDDSQSDGRRLIFAVRNPPGVIDPRRLSQRENAVAAHLAFGKPNKLIAYELGISESTVSVIVSRVARKLGTRSRAELVRKLDDLQHRAQVVGQIDLAGQTLLIGVTPRRTLPVASLTAREARVARSAAAGRSNREIAEELGRSPRTVANTLARVAKKLGLGSRVDLVHYFE